MANLNIINVRLGQFRFWFEQRETRERILVFLLSWAALYAVFNYTLYNHLDAKRTTYQANIAQKKTDIKNSQALMKDVTLITQTPLYKQWLKNQESKNKLESQLASVGKISPKKQWQDTFGVLLRTQRNITLIQIKNLPEEKYNPLHNDVVATKIYAQPLIVTVESNYFDFMNFMIALEKQLPFVHWDKLTYEVTKYPTAKMELEFSVLYEKPDA